MSGVHHALAKARSWTASIFAYGLYITLLKSVSRLHTFEHGLQEVRSAATVGSIPWSFSLFFIPTVVIFKNGKSASPPMS